MNERNTKNLHFGYCGDLGNKIRFRKYVDEKARDLPSTEVPSLTELAHEWAEKFGIDLVITEIENNQGGILPVIIEKGFNLKEVHEKQPLKPSVPLYLTAPNCFDFYPN